jgi:hypothetical protein
MPRCAEDAIDSQPVIKLVLQHLGSSSNSMSGSISMSNNGTTPTTATTTTSSSSSHECSYTVAANQQALATTYRHLHRVNRSWQAAARGTITHLDLGSYWRGCLAGASQPAEDSRQPGSVSDGVAASSSSQCSGAAAGSSYVPWALLSAVPGLRSLSLHTSQVPGLLDSPGDTFSSSIAARLTALEVWVERHQGRSKGLSLGWGVLQLPALLSSCTQLMQLRLQGDGVAALLPSGVVDVLLHLPLTRLDLHEVSLAPVDFGEVHLPAPDSTLELESSMPSAHSNDRRGGGDISTTNHNGNSSSSSSSSSSVGVPALLAGLQEVSVQHSCAVINTLVPVLAPSLLPQLRQLTRLTWDMHIPTQAPDVLGQLTQPRHLVLGNARREWVHEGWTNLTGVSHLHLPDRVVQHDDALAVLGPGIRFPGLQALLIPSGSRPGTLPAGYTALTMLAMPISNREGALHALQTYTRLQRLSLHLTAGADLGDALSPLACCLEVLALDSRRCAGGGPGWPRAQLGALSRLRSLSLSGYVVEGLAVTLDSASACMQLTQLQLHAGLKHISLAETELLVQRGIVPHLLDLSMGKGLSFARPELFAAWLGQHTALTQVHFSGCMDTASSAACVEVLPTTVVALCWPQSPLGKLPPCLSRLQQLQRLDVSRWYLDHLPAWLSKLQCLEWLSVGGCMSSSQPVLEQLPLLREVVGPDNGYRAEVLKYAPHLCWSPPLKGRQLPGDEDCW